MSKRVGEHTFVRQSAAAAAALFVLFSAGCGSASDAAPPLTTTAAPTTTVALPVPKPGGRPHEFADFKVAMDGSLDYLDPGLSDTAEGWGVMWNVYLPLIGYEHASGKKGSTLVPYLATALPTISPNGRVYTLHLRPGLRYSNGERVRASDFKKTIERDIVLDSAGAALFRNIAGATRFQRTRTGGISGIRTKDDGTIEIHLVAPEGDFENILASEFAAPVPGTSPQADTTLHPLPSTGPYEIVSYEPRGRIVAVRNPYFQAWRFHHNVPVGNPDRVTWDIVPTARAALRSVLSGKDDWMGYWPIPAKRLPSLEQRYLGTRLRVFTPPNLSYFFMNTHRPPFDNVDVRQAVNYAISRKVLVGLAGGLASATENILPPGYPSYKQHKLYPHNLVKAKRLVAASGERGKPVTVWNHDVPGDLPFTEYLVNVLNKLGFKAHQRVVTSSDYWSTLSKPKTKAQIGFANWFQDYPHPLDWFGVLLDGRQTAAGRNDNYAYFDVPSVTRKIESLTRQPDLTTPINAQWRRLDRQVMELAPWAPFLNREAADFFSARVQLPCYVNNVLYGFDYASICVSK